VTLKKVCSIGVANIALSGKSRDICCPSPTNAGFCAKSIRYILFGKWKLGCDSRRAGH